MMTRRTLVGAGLALVSVAGTASFAAKGATVRPGRQGRSIDTLFVDTSLDLPQQTAAFIKASARTLSVVGLSLDAAGQAGLLRALNESETIVGISSGATLFCVERMGWDHGFRLCNRSQFQAGAGDACRQEVAALVGGEQALNANAAPHTRTYRPSRMDGMLHVWAMQKSAGPRFKQGHLEV